MDRHILGASRLFLPDNMLDRSDLALEVARHKLVVEGNGSVGLLLQC